MVMPPQFIAFVRNSSYGNVTEKPGSIKKTRSLRKRVEKKKRKKPEKRNFSSDLSDSDTSSEDSDWTGITANEVVKEVDGERKASEDYVRNFILVKSDGLVCLDDIIGREEVKEEIQSAMMMNRYPKFGGKTVNATRGILLHGPPGTGKTLLAKTLASVIGCSFFQVSSGDLLSAFQATSEQRVRALFDVARERQPSIIFIDEIDTLCKKRNGTGDPMTDRVLGEVLQQMSKTDSADVTVIGATNRRNDLDAALLSRFRWKFEIPLPNDLDRERLFKAIMGRCESTISETDYKLFATETKGFSGRDIEDTIERANTGQFTACIKAKQFIKNETNGIYTPCSYPNCDKCFSFNETRCIHCGAEKIAFTSIESSHLSNPLTFDVIMRTIRDTRPSVSEEMLRDCLF